MTASTELTCIGIDPSAEYLGRLVRRCPRVPAARTGITAAFPFRDGAFSSATLLDVLEHVPDDEAVLRELHRVLEVGGLLLVSVPALHVFSFLDPDNAKFRFPRTHRFVWSLRYGRARYASRFLETDDGLVGDMSVGRTEHTNYAPDRLKALLEDAGFVVIEVRGANLFWRWFQVPGLLAPPPLTRFFDRAILVDGRAFRGGPGAGLRRRANLFIAASRS